MLQSKQVMQNDIVKPPKINQPSAPPLPESTAEGQNVASPPENQVADQAPLQPAPAEIAEQPAAVSDDNASKNNDTDSDELTPATPKPAKQPTSSGNGLIIGVAVAVCLLLVAIAIFLQIS